MADELRTAALEYAGYGWRIVPVIAGDKRPAISDWQNAASCDGEVIWDWWQRDPNYNVGIVMGPASGIIDIECDDAEAERNYQKIFTDSKGDLPVVPIYRANRGKHRIFKWSPNLPGPNLAGFKIDALEFRTGNGDKGSQSVAPPSMHESGTRYTWLVTPQQAEPVELTPRQLEAVVRLLAGLGDTGGGVIDGKAPRTAEHWKNVFYGLQEGQRNDGMASYIGAMMRGVADMEDSAYLAVLWDTVVKLNENHQPPMDLKELSATFRSIWATEKNRRMLSSEELRKSFAASPIVEVLGHTDSDKPTTVSKGEHLANEWNLTLKIMDSDPPRFLLYCEAFYRCPGSCIVLTADEIMHPAKVRKASVLQAKHNIRKEIDKDWNQIGGARLLDHLMDTAVHIEGPVDDIRTIVIASAVVEMLSTAHPMHEDVPGRNIITQLPDGSVVFRFAHLNTMLGMSNDHITRREISDCLETAGVKRKKFKGGAGEFKRLDRDALAKLDNVANCVRRIAEENRARIDQEGGEEDG